MECYEPDAVQLDAIWYLSVALSVVAMTAAVCMFYDVQMFYNTIER